MRLRWMIGAAVLGGAGIFALAQGVITVTTTVAASAGAPGKSWSWTVNTDPQVIDLTCLKPRGSEFGPVGSTDTCTLTLDSPAPNVGGSGGFPVPKYTISDPRFTLIPMQLAVPAGMTQASYQVRRDR